jgi:hypothetical protein
VDDLYSLAQGLRDGSTKRRRETIKQLAQYDDPDAMRYLAWAYRNDPDADNRQLAYRAGQVVRKRQQEAEDQAYSYSGGGSASSYASGYSSAPAYDDSSQSDYGYGTSYSYYENPTSSGYDPYNTADDHPYDTQPAKPARKQAQPSAASRAKIEAFERKQQRLNSILAFVLFVLVGTYALAIYSDYTLWIDLSNLPMRNGGTFGDAIAEAEDVLDLRGRWYSGNGVGPGFTGRSAVAVLSGSELPAEALLDSVSNVETVQRETGLRIFLNPYQVEEGNFAITHMYTIWFIATVAWFICVLLLLSYFRLENAWGIERAIRARIYPIVRIIGPRTVWLGAVISTGISFLGAVMFFVQSPNLVPQVVELMQLDLARDVTIGRQLGIGFWLALFVTGFALLVAIIGFVGIDEPKEKGA